MAARRAGRTVPANGAPAAAGGVQIVEVQRARVLAALVDAACERGVGAVTVGDIVGRAGVSRRTFYELFADREACLLAAFEYGVDAMAGTVVPAYEGERGWREGVRAGLGALLEFLEAEPELGWLCVVGALSGGERVLAQRARVLGVLQGAVDRGRAQAPRGREPAPLAAEGVVGAVFAVLHTRLVGGGARRGELVGLLGQLTGMIVLPYLGAAAARRELERAAARPRRRAGAAGSVRIGASVRGLAVDPLAGLNMRLTYRTLRVLAAVAERPGASNRGVANGAGILDQGQVSKLLARLESLGLVRNDGEGGARGAPNAWTLTDRGAAVERALRASGARRIHEVAGQAHRAA